MWDRLSSLSTRQPGRHGAVSRLELDTPVQFVRGVGPARAVQLQALGIASIGDLITYHQSVAEYDKMYAAIFSIMVFAVIFIEVLEYSEYKFFRPDKRVN